MRAEKKFDPLDKKQALHLKAKSIEKDFFGSSPAPFIGRFGYPQVNVGLLAPPQLKENTWEYDAPRHWAKQNYSISRVVELRSELINSRTKSHVRAQEKILDIAKQVGMASRSVDLEIHLKGKPRFRLNTDMYAAPRGPNAELQKAQITSNPKIHTKVDKVVDDTDLKAADAINYLYRNHFDENDLSKLLSVGTLGLKKNRKLVPTRWSITAADDTIGKALISKIKDFPESGYELYQGSYLGNHYFILLFPDSWQYELFETYVGEEKRNLKYMSDYESFKGRKDYAQSTAGGYYTVRLAIAEHLQKMKRQASVLAIRIITPEYSTPLGVWVTREAVRGAMKNKPLTFSDRELMVKYTLSLIQKKFGAAVNGMISQSILLKELSTQRKLSQFMA